MDTSSPGRITDGGGHEHKRNGILYPLMVIAAVAVILFSLVGIATVLGLLPIAESRYDPQSSAGPANAVPAERDPSPAVSRPRVAAAGALCNNCGVVESVRAVETTAPASGLGAVTGGLLGGIVGNQVGGGRGRTAMTVVGAGAGAYAGHEVENNMNRAVSYEVRVRMNDGSSRTFRERAQPAFAAGQKVRVTDGRLVADG